MHTRPGSVHKVPKGKEPGVEVRITPWTNGPYTHGTGSRRPFVKALVADPVLLDSHQGAKSPLTCATKELIPRVRTVAHANGDTRYAEPEYGTAAQPWICSRPPQRQLVQPHPIIKILRML